MESPPLRLNVAREEDRISALPDHLLLGILELIGLRPAVRAGALSTRWRHLPHQLSRLKLAVRRSLADMPVEAMDEFTAALLSMCPPAERNSDCQRSRAIKTLRLAFFLSAPHLSFISRAVEDVASRGQTKCLDFCIRPPYVSDSRLAEFGQQFMSLSRACSIAFWCLTRLTLLKLEFGRSDVADLISACDRLEFLSLQSCGLVEHSTLKIDTPCSGLQELQLILFRCTWSWIELLSVPKLRQVQCQSWHSENPPVRFDYVPELRKVSLISNAKAGQVPFYLSECLRNARNLSILHLQFFFQMIWIQPEHPKQLTAVFRNLMNVYLSDIFPECDLIWTLFILEAAQSLQNFGLSRSRHSCLRTPEDSAEKTNMVWEPSKDFKHLNLKLLQMSGFEEEDKVTTYIRLVME